jgi:hypothetical protein
MSPNVVGARLEGVQEPSLKSQVSVWLGAPSRKISTQLFAVLCRRGATELRWCNSDSLNAFVVNQPASPSPVR